MRNASFWRLAVIAVTAGGLSLAGAGSALAGESGPAGVAVSISTASSFVPVGGDTMVVYGGPAAENTATVSGTVTAVPAGLSSVVVTLLAEPFPGHAFTGTGQQVMAPAVSGVADYSFAVRPELATAYEAQVSAVAVGALPTTSAAATVYVIPRVTAATTACTTRPVCHGILTVTARYPAAAFARESVKNWYTYSGIRRSKTTTPAGPARLTRGGSPARVVARRAQGTVRFSVPFGFDLGTGGYRWKLSYCTKDTESRDGIGLPGQHGCGDPTVSATAPYLG